MKQKLIHKLVIVDFKTLVLVCLGIPSASAKQLDTPTLVG